MLNREKITAAIKARKAANAALDKIQFDTVHIRGLVIKVIEHRADGCTGYVVKVNRATDARMIALGFHSETVLDLGNGRKLAKYS